MRLQNLNIMSLPENHSFKSESKYKTIPNQLYFTGKQDIFVKSAENAIKFQESIQKVQETFISLIEDINAKKSKGIYTLSSNNEKLAGINREFDFINQEIDKIVKTGSPEDAMIMANYIDTMHNLDKNKGFNKISGYQKIKNDLMDNFLLKKVMLSHTSQEVDVPNALLFYGPTGNGKTLFANALAEQSLSNIEVIDAGNMSKEQAMSKIMQSAFKSKKEYLESGNQKQRTIILVNEADTIARKGSPVLEDFKELVQNCSDKYKCTLFLTTNHPDRFDKDILSKMITPIKIGIEPADRNTCHQIIHDTLEKAEKLPITGLDILTNELFRHPDKHYSNRDIVDILTITIRKNENPLIKDYIEKIESNDIPPSISKKEINKFYENKRMMENMD